MNKYIIEAIGTFFLVITIAFTGNPIAIGIILMAMIYMGGAISGGHYNPAVTLAVYIRGKINKPTMIRYWLSQIFGSTLASLTYFAISGTTFLPKPSGASPNIWSISLIELLFTFALCTTVLNVATSEKTKNNQYFGFAIGAIIMAGAFVGASLSGAVYNPAVAIGAAIVDMQFSSYWPFLLVYITSQGVGAMVSGWLYNQNTKE